MADTHVVPNVLLAFISWWYFSDTDWLGRQQFDHMDCFTGFQADHPKGAISYQAITLVYDSTSTERAGNKGDICFVWRRLAERTQSTLPARWV